MTYTPAQDRRCSILHGVDLKVGRALEVGPLHRPLLSKADGDILYADHLSTQQLLEKYKNDSGVPAQDVVAIDLVIGAEGLKNAVGPKGPFATIVASHVLEHVPDLLGWLGDVHDLLLEDGLLCLALPDKRFTFDAVRRSSTRKDVVDAHDELRTRPSLDVVCDAFRNSCPVTAADVWSGRVDLSNIEAGLPLADLRSAVARHLAGEYVDVHCWVFSSSECLKLMSDIVKTASFYFRPVYFRAPVHGGEEFHLQLRKSSARQNESVWDQLVAASKDGVETWIGVEVDKGAQ